MREYKVAYRETIVLPKWMEGSEVALCWQRIPVEVVGEHFALRFETVPHPAGEGLLMESWNIDHIPSGYRIHGGSTLNPVGRAECIALIRSLQTTPIDWATYGPDSEMIDGFALWFVHARDDAASGKVSPWQEHNPCGKTGGQ